MDFLAFFAEGGCWVVDDDLDCSDDDGDGSALFLAEEAVRGVESTCFCWGCFGAFDAFVFLLIVFVFVLAAARSESSLCSSVSISLPLPDVELPVRSPEPELVPLLVTVLF